ncbi:MAG: bifunctional homocysteine S-methyltransferase/methylenetetrahydrofolate reductase [Lachnospiraceae bacterium]
MNIRQFLRERILIADGAMGTYYDSLYGKQNFLVEEANLTNPQAILDIHKKYIESGARLIRTNTFASNLKMIEQMDLLFMDPRRYQEESIKAAYQLAKRAVFEMKSQNMENKIEDDIYIAADIGPIPLGEEDEDIFSFYKDMVDIFLDCGAEIFVLETFPQVAIVKQVADYIKEKRKESFIIAQFALNPTGYTQMGLSVQRIMQEADSATSIDVYGFNCGVGITHLQKFLKKEKFYSEKFVSAMPNCGYPHMVRGKVIYSDSVAYYGRKMKEIVELGVNIIGGCCGTTPAYIREISKDFSNMAPHAKEVEAKKKEEIKKAQILPAFMEKLIAGEKVIAVELDPPFTADDRRLIEGCYQMKAKDVDIVTVADSPLARSRADSLLCSVKIMQETGIAAMPHIACRDRNRISMRSAVLGGYLNEIRNILVVTGDPIDRSQRDITKKVFDFNSIQFMEYIKQMNEELFYEEPIFYGGALNQNNGKLEFIIKRMQKKIDAGASYFLTQPIYSDEDIEKIREIKTQLHTKILCGIMPLVSYRNAIFIKNEMPGIIVPDDIVNLYHPDMTREEATQMAIKISCNIVEKLYDVADGFYFMTPFHRVDIIREIIGYLRKIDREKN